MSEKMNWWIHWWKLGNEWKDELMNSLRKVCKWMKGLINIFTDES